MIVRTLRSAILRSATVYPIVAIIGPRQSGKTTLATTTFPGYTYLNLEKLDIRRFADEDPEGFLREYPGNVILDEIQRVPQLLSYLQAHTDERKTPGQYILTGSQHFLLMESISQSLAGRVALHTLLPFSYEEIVRGGHHPTISSWMFAGTYPRVIEGGFAPTDWYGNYVATYLERDIRLLSRVEDLGVFERFLRLTAGRTGQVLNLSSLASDVGISHNTARAWISLLETSFIVTLIQPYVKNFRKRLVKSPKLYMLDTGLAAFLLNIKTPEELAHHSMMGALFETAIVCEYLKHVYHQGKTANIYYWRDRTGREIDMVIDKAGMGHPIEIKAGATVASDWTRDIRAFMTMSGSRGGTVLYGGTKPQSRGDIHIVPWERMNKRFSELT